MPFIQLVDQCSVLGSTNVNGVCECVRETEIGIEREKGGWAEEGFREALLFF